MFFFFLFGCMEIRAEDCLTGIGYRDLELDGCFWIGDGFGSFWVQLADWFPLHLCSGDILLVSYYIMFVRLRLYF